MLAIIRGLKEWRHYLEGLDYFEIHSDHDSLQWWKRAQDLTRRQARWTLYLSRFHFKLIHKPGKNMGRADGLSRKAEYAINDGDDNRARIVLTPEHFARVGSLRGHRSEVRVNSQLSQSVLVLIQFLLDNRLHHLWHIQPFDLIHLLFPYFFQVYVLI